MIKLDSVEPVGNADTLKTCPFCEKTAYICKSRYGYSVECGECLANTDEYATEDEAVEAWNRRADNG